MSEPSPASRYSVPANVPIQITYTDDAPDVRQFLIDIKRDYYRRIKQIEEILSCLPVDMQAK